MSKEITSVAAKKDLLGNAQTPDGVTTNGVIAQNEANSPFGRRANPVCSVPVRACPELAEGSSPEAGRRGGKRAERSQFTPVRATIVPLAGTGTIVRNEANLAWPEGTISISGVTSYGKFNRRKAGAEQSQFRAKSGRMGPEDGGGEGVQTKPIPVGRDEWYEQSQFADAIRHPEPAPPGEVDRDCHSGYNRQCGEFCPARR